MRKHLKYAFTALILPLMFSNPAVSAEAEFDESVTSKCVVDGAKERRFRTEALTPSEQEIMDLERLGCHLIVTKDADQLIDRIVKDDALLFPPGGDILDGAEKQRAVFKSLLQMEGFELVYEPIDAQVSASDDMAWPNGAVEIGKYVSVWEKENGTWKNIVEIRNSNN